MKSLKVQSKFLGYKFLGYNLKVLSPEAPIKLAQVTLQCNRLEAEFYLNGIVADTDCDKIFSKRLVPNSSESWYVLCKWKKNLAIEHPITIPFAKFLYFVSFNFLNQTCCY